MKRHSEYLDYILECMPFVRGLRARRMFGGYGLYQTDLMFAIVADDVLYLKSDDAIQHEFMARGLKPFTYIARGRSVTIQYFEAPPDAFEQPEVMEEWTQKALGAALRAKKPPNKVRKAKRKKLSK